MPTEREKRRAAAKAEKKAAKKAGKASNKERKEAGLPPKPLAAAGAGGSQSTASPDRLTPARLLHLESVEFSRGMSSKEALDYRNELAAQFGEKITAFVNFRSHRTGLDSKTQRIKTELVSAVILSAHYELIEEFRRLSKGKSLPDISRRHREILATMKLGESHYKHHLDRLSTLMNDLSERLSESADANVLYLTRHFIVESVKILQKVSANAPTKKARKIAHPKIEAFGDQLCELVEICEAQTQALMTRTGGAPLNTNRVDNEYLAFNEVLYCHIRAQLMPSLKGFYALLIQGLYNGTRNQSAQKTGYDEYIKTQARADETFTLNLIASGLPKGSPSPHSNPQYFRAMTIAMRFNRLREQAGRAEKVDLEAPENKLLAQDLALVIYDIALSFPDSNLQDAIEPYITLRFGDEKRLSSPACVETFLGLMWTASPDKAYMIMFLEALLALKPHFERLRDWDDAEHQASARSCLDSYEKALKDPPNQGFASKLTNSYREKKAQATAAHTAILAELERQRTQLLLDIKPFFDAYSVTETDVPRDTTDEEHKYDGSSSETDETDVSDEETPVPAAASGTSLAGEDTRFFDTVIAALEWKGDFKLKRPKAETDDDTYWEFTYEGESLIPKTDDLKAEAKACLDDASFLVTKFENLCNRKGIRGNLDSIVYQAEAIEHLMREAERRVPLWEDAQKIRFYTIWAQLFLIYMTLLESQFKNNLNFWPENAFAIERLTECLAQVHRFSASDEKLAVKVSAINTELRVSSFTAAAEARITEGLAARRRGLPRHYKKAGKKPGKPGGISKKSIEFKAACDAQKRINASLANHAHVISNLSGRSRLNSVVPHADQSSFAFFHPPVAAVMPVAPLPGESPSH